MSNVIVENVEIMIQILREVSALADSIAELKGSLEQIEVDIADIKNEVKHKFPVTEGKGGCCYDY